MQTEVASMYEQRSSHELARKVAANERGSALRWKQDVPIEVSPWIRMDGEEPRRRERLPCTAQVVCMLLVGRYERLSPGTFDGLFPISIPSVCHNGNQSPVR